MSSETTEETITVRTEEGAAGPPQRKREWKCQMGDRHVNRDDVRKAWKECQEESFWYRALPFSVGSMAITGGLIYNGVWQSSKRFGPFPKLAVAGILGYVAGKASYAGACRSKFREVGLGDGPGFGPGFGPWSGGRRGGPFKDNDHGHSHHGCEDGKKKVEAAPAEDVKS